MTIRKNLMAGLGVFCGALALTGCGSSPPTHYFALSAMTPMAAPATLPPGMVLQVDTVTIPPQLDRLQMVRRLDANQVDISGFERWAAPLDEQIRRVLSDDLTQRSGLGGVIGTQAAAPPANLSHVAVDIDEFDGDSAGRVILRAHWAIVDGDHAEIRMTAQIDAPAASSEAGAVTAAMSSALGELSDQIIAAAAAPRK